MSIYVFVGPTLSRSDVCNVLPEAICLPPAARGDVYRVARHRPRIIAIIDGYFERVPSVWHKEILWAMASSVHVFGSSSIGALRAAELRAFGMEGVGRVFEAFASGSLEDDDEVAVLHGPADVGYRAFSEAMVDIRTSLAVAMQQGIVCGDCHDMLVGEAKRIHYRDRNYPNVLRAASGRVHADELCALAAWLPSGRVSQKRRDALDLLAVLKDRLRTGLPPKVVDYTVANTEAWRQLTESPGVDVIVDEGTVVAGQPDAVLDELRLQPLAYLSARTAALGRLFGSFFAQQHGLRPDRAALTDTAEHFRRARGLEDEPDLREWLERNDMAGDDFLRLLREEALIKWAETASSSLVPGYLRDHLRVTGEYAVLAARVADKTRVLRQCGPEVPSIHDVEISEEALMRWFVHERLGRDVRLTAFTYADLVGFESPVDCVRALVGEYRYGEELNRGHTE